MKAMLKTGLVAAALAMLGGCYYQPYGYVRPGVTYSDGTSTYDDAYGGGDYYYGDGGYYGSSYYPAYYGYGYGYGPYWPWGGIGLNYGYIDHNHHGGGH